MILFQHTKHKALWDKIIEIIQDTDGYLHSPYNIKSRAVRILSAYGQEPISSCYACDYDQEIADTFWEPKSCKYCPLNWPSGTMCIEQDSLYDNFVDACIINNKARAVKYATMIRDCPVKEGIETV